MLFRSKPMIPSAVWALSPRLSRSTISINRTQSTGGTLRYQPLLNQTIYLRRIASATSSRIVSLPPYVRFKFPSLKTFAIGPHATARTLINNT